MHCVSSVCVCVRVHFSPRHCLSIQPRCALGSIVIQLDLSAPLPPVSYLCFDVWEVFHPLSVWVNIPSATQTHKHTHTHTKTHLHVHTQTYRRHTHAYTSKTEGGMRWAKGVGMGEITKEQEGSKVQVNTCSVSKGRA